jgi:hypothetical protein
VFRQFDRQPDGRAAARAGGEHRLGDPVLEGVVGEHGDPSADGEGVDGGGEGTLPYAQFVVDRDTQRLEGPLARVPAGALRSGGDGGGEQLDELGRCGDGADGSLGEDRAGDPRGESLLAVVTQDPRQLRGIRSGQQIGRALSAALIHPHVERPVEAVGEAAPAVVELQRRDPEVEEDRLRARNAEIGEHGRHLVVDRVHTAHPVPVCREPLPRASQRLPVAVQPDQPGVRAGGQQRFRVPTQAQGGVEHDAAGLGERWREQVHDPVEQDGHVPEVGRCSAGHGWPLGGLELGLDDGGGRWCLGSDGSWSPAAPARGKSGREDGWRPRATASGQNTNSSPSALRSSSSRLLEASISA